MIIIAKVLSIDTDSKRYATDYTLKPLGEVFFESDMPKDQTGAREAASGVATPSVHVPNLARDRT
jgi:hypothetical protein